MVYDIRKPKITGRTDHEQLAEIKSYLFQLVDDLCYALSRTGNPTAVEDKPNTPAAMTGQQTFNAVKGFIMKSTEIVAAYYEAMGEKLAADYAAKKDVDDLSAIISSMADMIVETGETDGWRFHKTKTGGFTAFGTFTVTQTETGTAAGSLYETSLFSLSLPFSAADAAVFLSADAPYFPTGAKTDEGGDTISFKLYSPTEIAAGTTITVRVFLTGQMNIQEEVSTDAD